MLEERDANITDRDFISSCILYGARKGHYSVDVDNDAIVVAMKNEVKSILENHKLLDQRYAKALIYEDRGTRVGAVILCEASPGESCFEIYALSVVKKYQNRGYGSQMLDAVLSRLSFFDVCARCLPVSQTMSHLLMCRGFEFHSVDREFNVMLRGAMHQVSGKSVVD